MKNRTFLFFQFANNFCSKYKARNFQRFIPFFFILFSANSFAQQSFNKEPFIANANPSQLLIVKQFLANKNVKIVLDSFLFQSEKKMDSIETDHYNTGFKKNDFKYMPFNKGKQKCVDLGFQIGYDKKEKEYYTSGDHGQNVTVVNFIDSTTQAIWISHGFYPACDYAIWIGDKALALLIINSDDDESKPKFQFELQYVDLQKRIIKKYNCNKSISKEEASFWDFYFVKKGMYKK